LLCFRPTSKDKFDLKPPWWSLRSGVVQLPPSFPLSINQSIRTVANVKCNDTSTMDLAVQHADVIRSINQQASTEAATNLQAAQCDAVNMTAFSVPLRHLTMLVPSNTVRVRPACSKTQLHERCRKAAKAPLAQLHSSSLTLRSAHLIHPRLR
jgi:hypothetical protein